MRLWHPEVHILFGERLHYYLLTLRPFIVEKFKTQIEEFRRQNNIGGFCYYEVFGAFDVVLRVWVSNGTEDTFIELLRKAIPEIDRAIPFRVTNISSYWCRDEMLKNCEKDALDQVTVERVRSIQNGKIEEEAPLIKSKLLTEIESTPNIKFFIILSCSQPLTRTAEENLERDVTNIVESFKAPANQLSRYSIYFGYGFAWALIKAETSQQNYFLIGAIVNELSLKLKSFSLYTTTYLAMVPNHFEMDDISNSSLTTASGFDLTVARILPGFYKTEMDSGLRQKIIHWIQEHRGVDKLQDQQKELVARALSGVIQQEDKAVLWPLQEYFVEQERYLRKSWPPFLRSRLGDKTKEILRAVNIPEGTDSKFFSLGDMCKICAEIIKQSSDEVEKKNLSSGWQDVARLRNIVAHGACEPLNEWPFMLATLTETFSRLDLLKKVIDSALSAQTKT